MRNLSIIFILFLCISLTKANAFVSDNDSISFLEAVRKIENFHKVRFAFDHLMLSKVNVKQSNFEEPINDILAEIINSKKFIYEISEHTILIIPIRTEVKHNVSLSGYIVDEETGEALPNAVVYMKSVGKYAVTNRDGHFDLLNIPADTSMLEISYLGYLKQKVKPSQFQASNNVKINLSNRAELLNEITVSDIKHKGFEISAVPSKLSVRIEDLKPLSSFGEPDVFRALQLLPGISATNETSAGLSIRGGSSEQNLVTFDGFTIYHLDHFFGIFSAINSSAVKDIVVYKGGFGAEYGTRVSGVVDITGKTGNSYKPSGNLSINFISTNAILEFPVGKKVSVLIAARRSYTDVIQSSLYKKLFNHVKDNDPNSITIDDGTSIKSLDPNFYFYDLNSKVTYRLDDKNLFSFSLYDGNDNLFISDADKEEDEFVFFEYQSEESNKWGNEGAAFRYARQWNNRLFSDVNISSSKFFRDQSYNYGYTFQYLDINESIINGGLTGGEVISDTLFFDESDVFSFVTKNEVNETSIKIGSEYKVNDANILNFGLFTIDNETLDNQFYIDTDPIKEEEQATLAGIFAQYTFAPSNITKIVSGFRWSKYSLTNRSYFEPRLSISHKVHEKLNLKASIGKYYQYVVSISVNDIIATRSPYWWLSDDKDIPILDSNHFTAGFTVLLKNLTIDVETYYKTVNGLTEYFINQNSLDINGYEKFFTGDGRYYGLEFLIKRNVGKIDSWISYTLSKSENRFLGLNNNQYYPTSQNQKHEFKWVNIFTLNKWTLTGTFIYGSGKSYTRELKIDESPEFNYTSRNSEKLPNYHRFDVNIGYNTKLSKRVKMNFGLNLHNIYNRDNIQGYRYSYAPDITNDFDFYQLKTVSLLKFTPSLFVNMSF